MKNFVNYTRILPIMCVALIATLGLRSAQQPDNSKELYINALQNAEDRVRQAEQRVQAAEQEQKQLAGKFRQSGDEEHGLNYDTYLRLEYSKAEARLTEAKNELTDARNNAREARKFLAEGLQICACCKKQSYDLKKCSACKSVYYCSAECQQRDWPKHSQTEWQCPICLNCDDCLRTSLACKHQFHTKCFKEFVSSGGRTCPLCRAQFTERTCAHCGQTGYNFKRCSQCKNVFYCSSKCQCADWPKHKSICIKQ
jgi:hypothetical protein